MVLPISGQQWTVDMNIEVGPKKFTNAAGSGWTYENKEWILPALDSIEGGPIQDSEDMVLTVDDTAVKLQAKKMYNNFFL